MDTNIKVASREALIEALKTVGIDLTGWTDNYYNGERIVLDWIGEVEIGAIYDENGEKVQAGEVACVVNVRTLSYTTKISLPGDQAMAAAALVSVAVESWEKLTEVTCLTTKEIDVTTLPGVTVLSEPIRTFA